MAQALVLTLDDAGEPILYGDNVEYAGEEEGSRAVVAQGFEDRGSKALREGASEVKWISQRHRITKAAMEERKHERNRTRKMEKEEDANLAKQETVQTEDSSRSEEPKEGAKMMGGKAMQRSPR